MKFGRNLFVFSLAIGLLAGCYKKNEEIGNVEKELVETGKFSVNTPTNAMPGAMNDIGSTALIEAARLKEEERRSVEKELIKAVETGDLVKVKELVETGKFPVNARTNWMQGAMNDISTTALIQAASFNKFDIVKYLVENGADVNAVALREGEKTHSVLDCAKKNNNQEMIKFLQEKGALSADQIKKPELRIFRPDIIHDK